MLFWSAMLLERWCDFEFGWPDPVICQQTFPWHLCREHTLTGRARARLRNVVYFAHQADERSVIIKTECEILETIWAASVRSDVKPFNWKKGGKEDGKKESMNEREKERKKNKNKNEIRLHQALRFNTDRFGSHLSTTRESVRNTKIQ